MPCCSHSYFTCFVLQRQSFSQLVLILIVMTRMSFACPICSPCSFLLSFFFQFFFHTDYIAIARTRFIHTRACSYPLNVLPFTKGQNITNFTGLTLCHYYKLSILFFHFIKSYNWWWTRPVSICFFILAPFNLESLIEYFNLNLLHLYHRFTNYNLSFELNLAYLSDRFILSRDWIELFWLSIPSSLNSKLKL